MEKNQDLCGLRILVVGGKAGSVQVLRTAFGLLGMKHVAVVPESARAIEALRNQSFAAIFCDAAAEPYRNMSFPVAARRAHGVINPMAPLFIVYGEARRRQVEQARDVGVTDVLTHPVSAATIARKLRAALARPRSFIVAPSFFGPDRRTERGHGWYGQDRRKRTTRKARLAIPADPEPGRA
jgi:CheY-like chemotaxis protein